jgi:hypothetical protein
MHCHRRCFESFILYYCLCPGQLISFIVLLSVIFFFYVWGSVHHEIYISNCPTSCNNIQFIYICKLLYMFQVVTPLIIRSSYHCIYSIWHYWDHTAACLERDWMGNAVPIQSGSSTVSTTPDSADTVTLAPDDEWFYHLKHVEQFTNINKLYIVTSCWTITDMYYE